MSRPQTLTITGFILLGAVVVWQFRRISEMERTTSALLSRATDGTAREATSPDRRNGPSPPGGQPPGESPDRKPRNTEREAKFRAFRELERKQRLDAKILALTTKLNLTPEQQTTIRAALEKGNAERDALREAGFSRRDAGGKEDTEEVRRAEMAKFAAVDAAQEQAIAAGLSAEQLQAYTDYKTEQKQNSIENQANRQLGDLLKNFSLSEDQKDAAFQVYAKQAKDNPFEPDRIAAMGGDIRKIFEQQQKRELEAFKRILTPDQYELYRNQQEQRSSAFRSLTPGAGSGFGQGPGPNAGGPGAPPPPD